MHCAIFSHACGSRHDRRCGCAIDGARAWTMNAVRTTHFGFGHFFVVRGRSPLLPCHHDGFGCCCGDGCGFSSAVVLSARCAPASGYDFCWSLDSRVRKPASYACHSFEKCHSYGHAIRKMSVREV
jgi:hypothetical protein